MKIDLFDLFSARSAGVQIHCRLSMQAHNKYRAEIFSVLLISNTPPPPPSHIHEGQLLTKQRQAIQVTEHDLVPLASFHWT